MYRYASHFYFLDFVFLQMKGLAGASVFMWIIPDHASSAPRGRQVPIDTKGPLELPKCRFINLEALPGSKLSQQVGEGFRAMLLLENPVGENILTFEQLQLEVHKGNTVLRAHDIVVILT